MLRLLICIISIFCYTNFAKAGVLFDPKITFGSKFWQSPKPYVGGGISFSSLAIGRSEEFQGSFTTGISQFKNLTLHAGMRINGFLAAELAYARPYKNVTGSDGAVHSFSGDLLMLKGMLYPLSFDFGPIFSAELFLTAGAGYIIGAQSSYVLNGVNRNDSLNNTLNLLYGGGLQVGFMKYVSARFELNALSPINGAPFGGPYGNVMLFYNFTVSFYPF
jgi:hypothetical protein